MDKNAVIVDIGGKEYFGVAERTPTTKDIGRNMPVYFVDDYGGTRTITGKVIRLVNNVEVTA